MPSRNLGLALLISAMIYVAPSIATELTTASSQDGSAMTKQEIDYAVDQLEADPNLATERKTRTLKWKKKDEPEKEKPSTDTPAWLQWIFDLFSWLGESARVLLWVGAGLLVAILAVWIIRYVRRLDPHTIHSGDTLAPTHVRDLDIRPESLPDDIGKAALELWEHGEHRASLSLLYRGLLSRLAHKYAVPILHSSTEGECRILALQHLPPDCHAYVALLIRTWQGAVYGGNDPSTEGVRYLCANFVTLDQVVLSSASPPSIGSMTFEGSNS